MNELPNQSPSQYPPVAPIRTPLHPLLIVAAVAVIAACGVGIWTMTGGVKASADTVPPGASKAAIASNASRNGASSSVSNPSNNKTPPARLVDTTPHSVGGAPSASPDQIAMVDRDAGRIESVYATERKGEGSAIGVIGGGAVGGLLGNQIGGGNGRTAATVLGAVGGAFAGNQIEKQARATKVWNVKVRMQDGSVRTISQSTEPNWRVGDPVRVVNGQVVGAPGYGS